MKNLLSIAKLFKRNNIYTSLFSSALDGAVKDIFKEMGYRLDNKKGENDKKKRVNQKTMQSQSQKTMQASKQ